MKKNYITAFLTILFCIQSVNLLSQQQKTIAPGDRVRITTFRYLNNRSEKIINKPITGNVVSLNTDTLKLRFKSKTTFYLFENISNLEISIERKNFVRKGAKIGGIVGASIGAGFALAVILVVNTSNIVPSDSNGNVNTGEGFAFVGIFALAGGIAGLIPGAIIGKLASSETWEEIPIENFRRRQFPFSYQGIKIGYSFQLRR